jgi:ADP-L-glycero-D-manno-heptose 6-epimerase
LPANLREKYQYYTCADISRLLATGWAGPQFSLDKAVRDYVGHYLIPGLRLESDSREVSVQ